MFPRSSYPMGLSKVESRPKRPNVEIQDGGLQAGTSPLTDIFQLVGNIETQFEKRNQCFRGLPIQ